MREGESSPIDVMIIAFNEALNLPRCLEALQGWTHRVFVVDSGSTDGTQEIARAHGAEVVHHPWEGYARQKNWGLSNLPLESPWTLILDADEVITPAVRARLVAIANRPIDRVKENGYFINRVTYFLGRPIRHCGYFPSWNLRFFKRGKARYEDRVVHEHMIIDDPVGFISEPMIHDDRRGLEHYVAKHNRYSTLEAKELLAEIQGQSTSGPAAKVSRETNWRRWLKRNVLPHVPLPWVWRFFYMYVLRLGVLDGQAGLEFCKFISMYDYLVVLKYRALRRQQRLGAGSETVELPGSAGLAIERSATASMSGLNSESLRETTKATASADVAAADVKSTPKSGAQEAGEQQASGESAAGEARRDVVKPAAAVAAVSTSAHAGAMASTEIVVPPAPKPRDTSRKSVSVMVLTLNEEANLPECLESVKWCDDVVVLDSYSTDRTAEVAEARGARVVKRKFDNWSAHQNWAMEHIPFTHEWVFYLDADERMTPELRDELLEIANQPDEQRVAFYCGRKNYFMGRWIKRSMPPGLIMRFFKPQHIRFERLVNPTPVVSGEHGYLQNYFIHYNFSKGVSEWIEKHNNYSRMEAMEGLKLLRGELGEQPSVWSKDKALRRKALKNLSFRMPFRPVIKFLYMYFVRLGILDGLAGLTYCTLQAIYEYMIVVKMRELRRREKGLPI